MFYLLFLSPIVFLILSHINVYLNFVSVPLLDMTILSPIYLYFLFSFHLHCICISFLCNILFIFIPYLIPMLIPDIYPHCLSAIPIIVVFINTIIITIIIIIYAHFISRILLYPCLVPIWFQSLVSFYPNFIWIILGIYYCILALCVVGWTCTASMLHTSFWNLGDVKIPKQHQDHLATPERA